MSDIKDLEVLNADIRSVLSTEAGRVVIWEILGMCDLYSDSYTGDNRAYYNEGKRSVGLSLLQMFEEADPKIYPRLLLAMQEVKDD